MKCPINREKFSFYARLFPAGAPNLAALHHEEKVTTTPAEPPTEGVLNLNQSLGDVSDQLIEEVIAPIQLEGDLVDEGIDEETQIAVDNLLQLLPGFDRAILPRLFIL